MIWEEYLWLPSILAILLTTWFLFGKSINLLLRKRQIPPSPSPSPSPSAELLAAIAGEEYEVFLSFCGKDTRLGFTDFLYTYLCGAAISTFRDKEGLHVGEEIGPELLKAINDSKIYIPIFSKNYAYSKWCLLELAHMVKCQENGDRMIFPIFYDVDPSEVRHPYTGSYENAFRQHKRKFDEKKVQQWEEALGIVGKLKGLELKKETNWREGQLVKIVVEKVLSKLKKNYTHLPEILVGMDHHVDKLKELLNIESNGVRFVGIHGMGGLGKTTIAKVIYNQLCESFERHCFLEDIRENSNGNRIVNLQNQLVSKILKRQIPTFDDDNEGLNKIRGSIRGKKVFIVLDDVDKISQIEKLAGNFNCYGAGSRIIFTTRDAEVLAAFQVSCEREGSSDVYASYEPNLMDDDHSLKLFSKYAFMRDSPPKDYEILADDLVSNAGGLPLVLVTLGSLLSVEKDKVSWEERFKKLKAIPRKEVLERLRISYDALDGQQQQIFLDIACLFAGIDKTNPCYMWDDCNFFPLEGINALVRRSLITIREEDNTIRMHDQLRELGRQIVYDESRDEPGMRSRLWCLEEAVEALRARQLTRKVKVLCLDLRQDSEIDPNIQSQCLVGADLRFLRLGCANLEGDFKHFLPSLRWLQWSCKINFTPANFLLKNLVILDLSGSQITDEWKGWSESKMANKLKVLNLSRCYGLKRVALFPTFASLERLILSYCTSLEKIEPSGKNLKNLRVLNLSNCRSLKNLDCSMFPALESLDVQWCEQLRSLDGLEQAVSFKNLNLSFCRSLEKISHLPSSKKIEKLYFRKIDDNINYRM
ncbi:hypothetical protein LguiA_029550 [Lonicera macranthoides]